MIENSIRKDIGENNALILIVLFLTAILFVVTYNNYSKSNGEKAYSMEIIEIKCDGCFDLTGLSNDLEKIGVEVKNQRSLDYRSAEARKITTKYDITKVPAIVVFSKDINKINIDKNIFSVKDNLAIFDRGVPYVDLSSDEIKGLVKIKEIYDSNCDDCVSLSQFKEQLETFGVEVSDYEKINYSSAENNLIQSYNLQFVPTLLISKDIEEYWWLFDNLKDFFVEKNDYYVLSMPLPPYKEISTGKIKGKVNITYLANDSCTDCFNVSSLRTSFQNMGVYIDKEDYIDVSSAQGKSIIIKYNISAIPTVILSKELADYRQIVKSLENVGTFERDGSFIFRKLEKLNVKYQELSAKEGMV